MSTWKILCCVSAVVALGLTVIAQPIEIDSDTICASVEANPTQYLVQHSTDCTKYYQCQKSTLGWIAHPMECPPNTAFVPEIMACDYKQNVPRCEKEVDELAELLKEELAKGQSEAERKEEFSLGDKNGDGSLSPAEVAALSESFGLKVQGPALVDVFSEMDSDSSGAIDLSEYYAYWTSESSSQTEEEDKLEFTIADENQDGSLSLTELKKFMELYGVTLEIPQQYKQQLSAAQVFSALFSIADSDGNDAIDFSEFRNL